MNIKEPNLVLGVRYEERKNTPPPGLQWYKVKDGDTLGSIADKHHIRWFDLTLYNWHTIDPGEINWYLRNFVGCKENNNNGYWYFFSDLDVPGYILVPDVSRSVTEPPQRDVVVARGKKTIHDNTKLLVHPIEWLANGSAQEISGKWLYVFSGPGYDFGYLPPSPPLTIGTSGEIPKNEMQKPGSAFTLDFPGEHHITQKPDKLDYEIFVSSEKPPSSALVNAVCGENNNALNHVAQQRYKFGSQWHVLSDPTILSKATQDPRSSRATHALHPTKLVTLDLAPQGQARRYYFLLSPFQLGPKAVQYAMDHPDGLTPLLKSGSGQEQWKPDSQSGPQLAEPDGPAPDEVEKGIRTLRVIEPFAWAETLTSDVYSDSLEQYVSWIRSEKHAVTEKLQTQTGWSMDHYYVASLLKAMRDGYPEPDKIDAEIRDTKTWNDNIKEWQERLFKRTAEYSANAHRSLLAILQHLDGSGHKILETALMEDANEGTSQDIIDIAHGIIHWAVCTSSMVALEPGIVYLRELLEDNNCFVYQKVLQHFGDLEKQGLSVTLDEDIVTTFRYAVNAILVLLGAAEFVSEKPASRTSSTDFARGQLDIYAKRRRDNIVKIFNDAKLHPYRLTSTNITAEGGSVWTELAMGSIAVLDIMDKWTSYVLDPKIDIPKKPGLMWLANLEQKFQTGSLKNWNWVNPATSYTFKLGAFAFNIYNCYTTISAFNQEYQQHVTIVDATNATAGFVIAVQDLLAEAGAIVEKRAGTAVLSRLFPQATSVGAVGLPTIETGFGWFFTGLNVVAMLTAGATTMILMAKNMSTAVSRGDYTAAVFYGIGFAGGTAMTAGAVCYGIAIFFLEGGAATSWSGIGIALFFIGGIVAVIGGILGAVCSSDDFQVFARKCFLGVEGDLVPRFFSVADTLTEGHDKHFGHDGPDWSYAKADDSDWAIEKQKWALHNLLGMFKLTTVPGAEFERDRIYTDMVDFTITPGLLVPGSTFEVALHYDEDGTPTSATFRPNLLLPTDTRPGELFDVKTAWAGYQYNDKNQVTKIVFALKNLFYDGNKGDLHCTVSLRFPGLPNVIRCKKEIMEHGVLYGVNVDDSEAVSEFFDLES